MAASGLQRVSTKVTKFSEKFYSSSFLLGMRLTFHLQKKPYSAILSEYLRLIFQRASFERMIYRSRRPVGLLSKEIIPFLNHRGKIDDILDHISIFKGCVLPSDSSYSWSVLHNTTNNSLIYLLFI